MRGGYQPMMGPERAERLRVWHEAAVAGGRRDSPITVSLFDRVFVVPPDVYPPNRLGLAANRPRRGARGRPGARHGHGQRRQRGDGRRPLARNGVAARVTVRESDLHHLIARHRVAAVELRRVEGEKDGFPVAHMAYRIAPRLTAPAPPP